MTIEINSPSDSFNLIEVLEFRYTATPKQISDKKLYIKCKRYRDNGDGTYSYSDEPPFDIFLKDVDQHIADDMAQGETDCYEALSACMICVATLSTNKAGITASVV